jgi:primosomal protein N''
MRGLTEPWYRSPPPCATYCHKAPHTSQPYSEALLPDDVPPLAEAKALHLKRHQLFTERGEAALDELEAVRARLRALSAHVEKDFPMTAAEAAALREKLAAQVLAIHDVELKAVEARQGVMK